MSILKIYYSIFFFIAVASHNLFAPPQSTLFSNPLAAITALRIIIKDFPIQDKAAQEKYIQKKCPEIIQAAKTLYDQAHYQILEALQVIGTRIAYWQYQKDHEWSYFFGKDPRKWFSGKQQKIEIEDNLNTLKSHQGELYVLLGQLSKREDEFNKGFKNIFIDDYTKGYEWIDRLLNVLSRITIDQMLDNSAHPFIQRINHLVAKLQKAPEFKKTILSDIKETAIPHRLARNWLTYGTLLIALGYGYSNFDMLSKITTDYFIRSKSSLRETMHPVKELFFPSTEQMNLLVQEGNIQETQSAMKNLINKLWKDKIITEEERNIAIEDTLKRSNVELQKIWNEKIIPSKLNLLNYGFEGGNILLQSGVFYPVGHSQKQFEGVRNIFLLAPAALLIYGTYHTLTRSYKWLTAKNYNPLRRTLVDINSLFVDPTQPLSDEQYGQMIYLIYNLKELAQKTLSGKKSVLEEFMNDLERIASHEYNVVAKRNIIDDMFKKYIFLGMIQQKSA